MKIYLLIILFLIFVLFAIVVYLKFYYKYVLYKDIVYICKNLKNNISFNKNTIDTLLYDASKNISGISRFILNSSTDKKNIFISKNDILCVKGFISSLGRGDVSYEINNINYYENDFNDKKNEAKEKLDKDGKMYLKLIIGIGLAVCIILI